MDIIVPLGVIFGGFAMIVIGVKARTFYAIMGAAQVTNKQINPALGRATCCIVGLGLIVTGVWALVSQLRS